jgi:integrase
MPTSRSSTAKPAVKSTLDHHLFKRGDLYWCKYYVEGVERRIPLRTAHVASARLARDRMLRDAETERLQVSTPAVPEPVVHRWEDAVELWLGHLEAQVRSGALHADTATRYRASVKILSEVLEGQPMDAIVPGTVLDFVEARRAEDRAPRTIGNDLTAWSRVHVYAMQRGMAFSNPARDFDRRAFLGAGSDLLDPPSDAEVHALVEEIGGWSNDMARLIIWLRETGMRLAEALRVRAEDLHPDKQTVTLRHGVKRNANGAKTRTILLGRAAPLLVGMPEAGRLFGALHTDSAVVSTRYGQWRRQRQGREDRAADAEGRPARQLRSFRLHDLRHAYAIASILDDDTCVYRLRDHLGHGNLATTERYLRFLRGEGAQRIYGRNPDLFGSLPAPMPRPKARLRAVG